MTSATRVYDDSRLRVSCHYPLGVCREPDSPLRQCFFILPYYSFIFFDTFLLWPFLLWRVLLLNNLCFCMVSLLCSAICFTLPRIFVSCLALSSFSFLGHLPFSRKFNPLFSVLCVCAVPVSLVALFSFLLFILGTFLRIFLLFTVFVLCKHSLRLRLL